MSDTQFLDIKEKARGYLNDLQGVSFEKRFCIKTVTFSLRGFLEAEYGDLVFRWPSQEELDGDKSLHAILERISSEDNVLSAGKLSKKEIINFRNRRFVVSAEGRVYVLEGYRDSKVYLREFDLESGWQWKELDIDDFIAQEKPQVIRVVSKKADDAPFGWKWFFALLKVNSSLFNTAIVCSLIIGVLSLAMPFYFQIVLDKFLSYPNHESLYAVTFGVVVAFLFLLVFEFLKNENVNFLSKKIDAHIVRRVSEKFLTLSLLHGFVA